MVERGPEKAGVGSSILLLGKFIIHRFIGTATLKKVAVPKNKNEAKDSKLPLASFLLC